MVRHLIKTRLRVLYRGSGGIGIAAACRTLALAGADPTDSSRLVLASIVTNVAAPLPSLAYRIAPQPNAAPTIEWLGESAVTADDLNANRLSPRAVARAFLEKLLAPHALPVE